MNFKITDANMNPLPISEEKQAELRQEAEAFIASVHSMNGGAVGLAMHLFLQVIKGEAFIIEGRLDGQPVRALADREGSMVRPLAILIDHDFGPDRTKLEDGYGSADNPMMAVPLTPPPASALIPLLLAVQGQGCGDPDCPACGAASSDSEATPEAQAEAKVPARLH